jgi:hypothetical protein
MNRIEANKLLDKARDGTRFTFEEISAALYATGDLYDPNRSPRMETTLQAEDQAAGQSQSPEVVVSSEGRHPENSWAGWSKYLDKRNEQA